MSEIKHNHRTIKSLTLLEASELVTEIEKFFGVDTCFSSSSWTSSCYRCGRSPEEKSAFDVVLDSVPADKRLLS
jgi:large subunit ribosomal protein L7/L12